jgi:hypothetical protein
MESSAAAMGSFATTQFDGVDGDSAHMQQGQWVGYYEREESIP